MQLIMKLAQSIGSGLILSMIAYFSGPLPVEVTGLEAMVLGVVAALVVRGLGALLSLISPKPAEPPVLQARRS